MALSLFTLTVRPGGLNEACGRPQALGSRTARLTSCPSPVIWAWTRVIAGPSRAVQTAWLCSHAQRSAQVATTSRAQQLSTSAHQRCTGRPGQRHLADPGR